MSFHQLETRGGLHMQVLETVVLGNSVEAWGIALGATIAGFVFLRVVAFRGLSRVLRAASTDKHVWDDVLLASLTATKTTLLFLVAAFVGSLTVSLPSAVTETVQSVAIVALLLQAGLWIDAGLSRWLEMRTTRRRSVDPAEVMTVNIIGLMAKIALWSIVFLLALENFGIDVTALIAGLGIGGIAVALAAQNILGDLFASLSIVLDKPFVLGDFVTVGDYLGSVEAIGLKTTRLRSLSGEQVIFSNADLLSSRIRNYGRMYQRRVVLSIGVTYQTPRTALAEIPGIIQEAIEGRGGEQIRFDRAHLKDYDDSAIVFEAVYVVLEADYALHMDIKQDVYLRVHEVFEQRGIEFAYPTQTVFVESASTS
jgi:small-conductance mechanosensitive channel